MTKIDSLQGQLQGSSGAALTTTAGNGGSGGGRGGRLPHENDTPSLDMSFVEGTELFKWRVRKVMVLAPLSVMVESNDGAASILMHKDVGLGHMCAIKRNSMMQ